LRRVLHLSHGVPAHPPPPGGPAGGVGVRHGPVPVLRRAGAGGRVRDDGHVLGPGRPVRDGAVLAVPAVGQRPAGRRRVVGGGAGVRRGGRGRRGPPPVAAGGGGGRAAGAVRRGGAADVVAGGRLAVPAAAVLLRPVDVPRPRVRRRLRVAAGRRRGGRRLP